MKGMKTGGDEERRRREGKLVSIFCSAKSVLLSFVLPVLFFLLLSS
jgi:hypothetical protein